MRRALRIRTAFNLLGPLLNPARPPFGLIGIYSPSIAPLMAAALQVCPAAPPPPPSLQSPFTRLLLEPCPATLCPLSGASIPPPLTSSWPLPSGLPCFPILIDWPCGPVRRPEGLLPVPGAHTVWHPLLTTAAPLQACLAPPP